MNNENTLAEMTVPEFVSEYLILEEKACMGDITSEEVETYLAMKSIIAQTNEAQLFLENNTYKDVLSDNSFSVMEEEKLRETYDALTCGNNKDFKEFVSKYSPSAVAEYADDMENQYWLPDYASDEMMNKNNEVVGSVELLGGKEDNANIITLSDRTMGEVMDAIDVTAEKKQELEGEIGSFDSRTPVTAMLSSEKVIKIEEIEVEEVEKKVIRDKDEQEHPAVEDDVVVSSDGYALNTAAQTSNNSVALSAKVNGNGETTMGKIASETTNDTTSVKANVKLETVKNVGSKELSEIASGNGTDNDIEAAAESSPEIEKQTDRHINRSYDFER